MKANQFTLDDRSGFKFNLVSNPNYYGNLDIEKFGKPIKKIVSSETYERLKCISYHPKTKELRGTVLISKQNGYLGSHCGSGSREYIRFYVDYKNNGDWTDEGVTSFKIHDIEGHKGLCYGIKLKIKPKVSKFCKDGAVLPNVRAILSWNIAPPADTPNYKPVWGSVKEARIQIAPRFEFVIPPLFDNPSEFKLPTFKTPILNLGNLKKVYKNKVDDARLVSMTLQNVNTSFNLQDLIANHKKLNLAQIDIPKVFEIIQNPKFNTTYEELKCVGLNRRFNELHADIQIKKSVGYSGDLCSKGSKEYVAFYMDFGSGWEFMGTSSVTVHDIDKIPKDGLWYNTFLPVELTPYQKKYCQEGKATIKGILSWNSPPAVNAPNYVSTWGDWEVCDTEIKPLPKGYQGIANQPWIESMGGVDEDIINPTTGLASGVSGLVNSIVANYSPFDGKLVVTGKIIKQNPVATYKVMVKEPGGPFKALQNTFDVIVTTFNTSNGLESEETVSQTPVGDYYTYLPKNTGVIQKHVNGNILAEYYPSKPGIHKMFIQSNTNEISEIVEFMVDKDRPVVDMNITSGTGNCGKFKIGQIIEGNFEVKNDRHLDYVKLTLAPFNPQGIIQSTVITSFDTTSQSGNLVIKVDDQDSNMDYVRGVWKIDTSNLPACGYTIHIRAEDRTIINSSSVGKHAASVSRGFCLE